VIAITDTVQVELGGTDQLFNLNVGRDIMPAFGLEPQIVMTTPLLEGLDGVEKMSKSLGNYVGVTDSPAEMFGKLMSISDDLMWKYYTLLTDLGPTEILRRRNDVSAGRLHPKQAKVDLATRIVSDFHGDGAAARAADDFERRFAKKELPADLPVIEHRVEDPPRTLERLLADHGYASSGSDAARKLKQGGVKLDGQRFETLQWRLTDPAEHVVEVGRKAFRLRVTRDPS
jgi:tyrosyl-tRNA synthetase